MQPYYIIKWGCVKVHFPLKVEKVNYQVPRTVASSSI